MVTDDILYRRYLGGDEDSLSALMERHGDKLTLYLDGCLHDLHESEDLMIEAFAYLIAKQPRIRDGGFRAYLYRSARRPVLRRSSVSRWRCRPSRRASPARTTMAAASLFSGESLGYLLVGLLAFALGVCVTVLCVRLHERERDEGSEEERGDA